MLLRLIGSVLGNAAGLLATQVVPGISFSGSFEQLLLAGALFGLFNLIVRPLASDWMRVSVCPAAWPVAAPARAS